MRKTKLSFNLFAQQGVWVAIGRKTGLSRVAAVIFSYRTKELTLSALEFVRRFSLHILPPGLVRIRHCWIPILGLRLHFLFRWLR